MPFNIQDIQEARAKLDHNLQVIVEQEAAIAVLEAELDAEYHVLHPVQRNEVPSAEASASSEQLDSPDEEEDVATPVGNAPPAPPATPATTVRSEEDKLRQALAEFAWAAKSLKLEQKRQEVAAVKANLQVLGVQLDCYERCAGHFVSLATFNKMHGYRVDEIHTLVIQRDRDAAKLVSTSVTCQLDDCTEADFVTTVADHIQQRAHAEVIDRLSSKQPLTSFHYEAAVSNVDVLTMTTALAQKLSVDGAFAVEDQSQVAADALKRQTHVDLLVRFTNPLATGVRNIILAAKTCGTDHAASPRVNP